MINHIHAGTAALACVLLLGALAQPPQDKVVFLDIGQGDGLLIQSGTQQMIIDGGPGAQILERLSEEMPAFDRRVEVVINTHPDKDHLEGILHVLERYEVGLVLLPHYARDTKLFQSFIGMLIEKEVPYRFAWAGQRIYMGDAVVQILAPLDTLAQRSAARDSAMVDQLLPVRLPWVPLAETVGR
jgi:competence protein ComEC